MRWARAQQRDTPRSRSRQSEMKMWAEGGDSKTHADQRLGDFYEFGVGTRFAYVSWAMTTNYSGITITIAANGDDREIISTHFKKHYPEAILLFLETKKTRPAIQRVEVPNNHSLAHGQVKDPGEKHDLLFHTALFEDGQDRLASLFAPGHPKT